MLLRYVEPRTQLPLPAVAAFLVAGIAFATSVLGENPLVALYAATGIGANGTFFVYGLPCLLRLTTGRATFKTTKGTPEAAMMCAVAICCARPDAALDTPAAQNFRSAGRLSLAPSLASSFAHSVRQQSRCVR